MLSGWKPTYVLPAPTDVLGRLASDVGTAELWTAIVVTLRRAVWGFGIAVVIGVGDRARSCRGSPSCGPPSAR